MTQRSLILAFWSATCFTLVMAFLPSPPTLPGDTSDKTQHILAFSVLAGLAAGAYPLSSLRSLGVKLSLLGIGIEMVQAIPALGRDADLLDWVADTISVVAVLGAVFFIRRRAASSRH